MRVGISTASGIAYGPLPLCPIMCTCSSTPQKRNDQEWFSLSAILHSLKSYTAKKINALMNRKGPLWIEESFDRIMRSEEEFLESWHYIMNNAAKKCLCESPEDWPWLYESAERDFL